MLRREREPGGERLERGLLGVPLGRLEHGHRHILTRRRELVVLLGVLSIQGESFISNASVPMLLYPRTSVPNGDVTVIT